MTWVKKFVDVIKNILIVTLMVTGVIVLVRYVTKGKWPKIDQNGPIEKPPTNSDLPTSKDCDNWLKGNTTKVLIGLLTSVMILSSTWNLSANTSFITNAVKGMYEYSQILEGTSIDSITNIFQLTNGEYKLWYRISVKKWPPESNSYRHILRGIPIKLDNPVQTSTPWGWIIGSFIVGGLIGFGIAK